MDPFTIGLIGVIVLTILIMLGFHVVFAASLVGLVGTVLTIGTRRAPDGSLWDKLEAGFLPGVSNIGTIPFSEMSHYAISVLPMFILIGYLAFHANLTQNAFYAMRMMFGWMPGGLAVATVFSTAAFAAVSGASTATAAVFSRVAIPEMERYGYPAGFSAGVVAAGGTLASLIPPSGILVLYAFIIEESIGRLLVAGFIPGLISAVIYAGAIMIRVRLNPELGGQPMEPVSMGERFASLSKIWGILAVVAVIMGGIYTGKMTPTESGAVGAAIIFGMALWNGMNLRQMFEALSETAKTTVMILAFVWGILMLVRFLGFSDMPGTLRDLVLGLEVNRYVILLVILLMYAILGMFMDAIGMLLLTLPFVHPLITGLGFDPIWFGIIVVKMVEIGLITPPIGMNCFVVAGVRPDIPLPKIFGGVWWFFVCDILTIGLLIAFPAIILWLPNQMFG